MVKHVINTVNTVNDIKEFNFVVIDCLRFIILFKVNRLFENFETIHTPHEYLARAE